jgi:hypothetical protein
LAVTDHRHLQPVGRDRADGQLPGTAQADHRALPLELVDAERAGPGERRAVQMGGVDADRHRPMRPPPLFIARELALTDHQPAVAAFEAQPVERVLRPRRHRADRRARHHLDRDVCIHLDRLETGEAEALLGRRRGTGERKGGHRDGGAPCDTGQGAGHAAALTFSGRQHHRYPRVRTH